MDLGVVPCGLPSLASNGKTSCVATRDAVQAPKPLIPKSDVSAVVHSGPITGPEVMPRDAAQDQTKS